MVGALRLAIEKLRLRAKLKTKCKKEAKVKAL